MIVVDTSALVDLYLGVSGHGSGVAQRVLGSDPEWYAPSHQPVELLSSMRGLVLGHKIPLPDAEAALKLYGMQTIGYVEVVGAIAERVWELRNNVSAYDAAYAAVAEALDCALVTADARLAAAPGLRCEVRVIR
ncbi:type II toxin-antitoxin system VapC family toxin [Nocardiopsis changdeensis]|uniref:Ribonuclease VapC n=1 Tax=Nocardiopsis changdeensis TaxID=2831969 RepID=A0ABX8BV14_9ACTN|nr:MULTISPECIES: PIN domain-containing protein [Nocardiopsis]QUX24598.1 PIN domain-containing protein [Nocardiopsis changdeensis]QYX34986.1 PIN domain-containing protein [Nocardiopsis sp. MT53]